MNDAPLVLLINPRMCSRRSARLPLSLLSLGAVLEGRYRYRILDGNLIPDLNEAVLAALRDTPRAVAAVTVMPGPQVATAIDVSVAIRSSRSDVPILWGGYFPTLYPDAAVNAPYVDAVVRGQGEDTLLEALDRWTDTPSVALMCEGIRGVSWQRDGAAVHNDERPFRSPDELPPLRYDRLDNADAYLARTFMGRRTAVYQAAIGCRYRCTFCGVVSMFNGQTRLQGPNRLRAALAVLQRELGADGIQYYDNNFFDRQDTTEALLDVLADVALPWWCYARTDALAGFTPRMWDQVRRSRMRMAYIGAEAGSNEALRRMQKGARVEQTLEVAARLRENGVIPEFSFVLGGPDDPEGETERTLQFVRRVKRIHPHCEVILYFFSPTPQRDPRTVAREGALRPPVLAQYGPAGPALPTTPEEWTEPRWIRYVCHQDAPWLTPKLRQRVRDFGRVLECRFPTVQDHRTPRWQKSVLRELARWRWATGVYARPLELDFVRSRIALRQPQVEGL